MIAHELCHWRRRDNLTAAVHMVVETVFWFHPLVWWIGARLVDERERACDEVVVGAGHDRVEYAEAILRVCESYAAAPVRCAAGVGGAELERRIAAIMRRPKMMRLTARKKALLGAAALAALAVPVLSGVLTNGSAFAQDQEPYLPLVKVAPVYPVRAAQRGLEGYVVVQYTVTTEGAVRDAFVVESSSTVFDEPALESARKYKYAPRIANGVPVEVPGVRTVIRFELAR